jgi:NADH:ubiquinone reductase (H+-translocating)
LSTSGDRKPLHVPRLRRGSAPELKPLIEHRPQVVILGGGFGGLAAARGLRHAPVDVTLVDHNNHHLFQPLLYQVATAGLAMEVIGFPLRTAVRRQANTDVLMAEAESIDPASRTVRLADRNALAFDYLIVATGAQPSYLGHEDWSQRAPSLKSLADAMLLRSRVLEAFERGEIEGDPEQKRAELSFVIVGGGPTGVELAGAIAELARHGLRRDFRHIDPATAKVLLVEGGPSILPSYPAELQKKALEQLGSLGVEVRTHRRVEGIDENGILAGGERVEARTVLWAAGVHGTPIVRSLGVPVDRHGKVQVTSTLRAPGLPNVFVIGDLAALEQDGKPVPGVAPAAIQEGRFAAHAIAAELAGEPVKPFRYRDKGELATIGRSRAVGIVPGGVMLSGFVAWLMYGVVHLYYLMGAANRARAFFSWAWSFLTYRRGARLIPRAWREEPRRRAAIRAPARC